VVSYLQIRMFVWMWVSVCRFDGFWSCVVVIHNPPPGTDPVVVVVVLVWMDMDGYGWIWMDMDGY